MKFKMLTNYLRPTVPNSEWWEYYDKEEINTPEHAEAWCKAAIDNFNSTLREHERPRVFLSVEMIGKSDIKHAWGKTNLITVMGKEVIYDTYQCSVCGITGKRYGLSERITRDGRYKAQKYEFCVSSI